MQKENLCDFLVVFRLLFPLLSGEISFRSEKQFQMLFVVQLKLKQKLNPFFLSVLPAHPTRRKKGSKRNFDVTNL